MTEEDENLLERVRHNLLMGTCLHTDLAAALVLLIEIQLDSKNNKKEKK